MVIFYSLKFRLIIISQCFFVKWTDNTPKSMGMWCSRHGFFGLWDGSAFIYQASCRPRLLMLGRFFPSIKHNYIFALFIFLLGNKFGQKSANLAHHYCFGNKKPHNFTQIFPEIGKKGQFKPKKDPPGILALGYYFFSFLDISKNSWTKPLKNMRKISSWA